MASVLEKIIFEPAKFQRELQAFDALLKSKADLSEMRDIQPFFKESKHLTAYLGTFALNIAVATEICFEYEFFGDFKADILLGAFAVRSQPAREGRPNRDAPLLAGRASDGH